jgi:hypothetical protein
MKFSITKNKIIPPKIRNEILNENPVPSTISGIK